jgi:cephalosporin hydroxylase
MNEDKLIVDLTKRSVTRLRDGAEESRSFADPAAFDWISHAWLQAGWDAKYVYSFTWLGRPVIQLPEDMMRLQEVIHRIQPDVIIETGVAHGGGLIFYASLCKLMNRGRVIGVDIEIRPHNRKAIESHPLFPLITLIEGSSVDPNIIQQVNSHVRPGDRVLVLLDSNHSRSHVLQELRAYAPLVSLGSYIVATDGIMKDLAGAPRSQADWTENNPYSAAHDFVKENAQFEIEEPQWLFNESICSNRITYWPHAYIKRQFPNIC